VRQPSTPLSNPGPLIALLAQLGDHTLTRMVATAFDTWEQLHTADLAERTYRLGAWAAQLHIPAQPQLPAPLPGDLMAITSFNTLYPSRLGDLDDAPALLFLRGAPPPGPLVGIGGPTHPPPAGLSAARVALEQSADAGLTVVAQFDGGTGSYVLATAAREQLPAVGIVPTDLTVTYPDAATAETLLSLGGTIVTETPPNVAPIGGPLAAARLVAGWATVQVITEMGAHPGGGAALARAAIRAGRYVVVPQPGADIAAELSSAATSLLTGARSFSSRILGTSTKVQRRVSAGLSPADAVVTNPHDMGAALRAGCWGTRAASRPETLSPRAG